MPRTHEGGRKLTDAHRFEADGRGLIYAEFENGEVLPTRLKLPSLAGRSEITHDQLNGAIQAARRG